MDPQSAHFFGVGVRHLQHTYLVLLAVLQEVAVTVDLPDWVYLRPMWIFGLATVVGLPLTFDKTISKFSKVPLAAYVLIFMYLVHSAVYLGIAMRDNGFDSEHEIRYLEPNNFFVTSPCRPSHAIATRPSSRRSTGW
jgi:hypothetical protein